MKRNKEKYHNITKVKLNQKVAVFIFFLGIATIFWFLNALNSEYTTKISYNSVFINPPHRKSLPIPSSAKLTLSIKGYGFDILALKLASYLPYKIDITKYAIYPKSTVDSSNVCILSNSLINSLQDNIGTKVRVTTVYPDTLFLNLSKAVTRKMPVNIEAELHPFSLYLLNSPIVCKPESLWVSGPQESFENIHQISTEKRVFEKLRDSFQAEIRLVAIRGLVFSEAEVQISAFYEQYTEIVMYLPLTVINLPDNLHFRTFPKTIRISFKIPLRRYDEIKESQFVFALDYNLIKNNLPRQIVPELVEHAPGISDLKISPSKLDYLIEM